MPPQRLSFEKDIYEMEDLLARLEAGANGQLGTGEEVRRIRRELVNLKRKIYSDLSSWQTVEVARCRTTAVSSSPVRAASTPPPSA